MEKSQKVWDRFAEGYAKRAVADEAAYQKKLKFTQQYLNPQMNVLEFGCGTGSTALTHAPFTKHILATDFSAKMIEIANAKKAAAGIDNVTFKQLSINQLDEGEQSFDMVMGHSILHLLDNKDAAIKKVYGLLKSGGTFVTSTICLGDSIFFRCMAMCVSLIALFGLLPSLSIFTSRNLLSSLREAGFEIEYQWQPKPNSALFIVAKKP